MTSKTSSDSRWPKLAKIAASVQHRGQKVSVTPGNTPVIDSPHAIVTRAQGPLAQVNHTNTVSTPVLLIMLAAMILSIAMAAYAIGTANQAEREAQNAEREARVAINKAEELSVKAEVNKTLIETYVIKGKE